jgi:hypothetical protein
MQRLLAGGLERARELGDFLQQTFAGEDFKFYFLSSDIDVAIFKLGLVIDQFLIRRFQIVKFIPITIKVAFY